MLNDVLTNEQTLHLNGWLVHLIIKFLVLVIAIYKVQLYVSLHQKALLSFYQSLVFSAHPLQFLIWCLIPKHLLHQFYLVIQLVAPLAYPSYLHQNTLLPIQTCRLFYCIHQELQQFLQLLLLQFPKLFFLDPIVVLVLNNQHYSLVKKKRLLGNSFLHPLLFLVMSIYQNRLNQESLFLHHRKNLNKCLLKPVYLLIDKF